MDKNTNKQGRVYDVVVWGATGFTGRLVAHYLARRVRDGLSLRWAIAGRNPEKLQQTLAECALEDGAPEVIVADSHDRSSLDTLASQTCVVLTTVGPYALYGSELVAACVANGTDYCDLSGEVQWMHRMLHEHRAQAEETGARIVHCCGFDSIPSDLGVQFLQEHAQDDLGKPCDRIELIVKAMRGGGSGGTIASGLNAFDEARRDRSVARVLVDPYALNPDDAPRGPDGRDQQGVRYSELGGCWTGPFVMAGINTRIVRRSNALLGFPYGENFRYSETMGTGRGISGWIKGTTLSAGLGGFFVASAFGPTRKLIVDKLVPAPGEGPDEQERENGFFDLRLYGAVEGTRVLAAKVTGDRDPGYGSTSKMLSEAALCLAHDKLDADGGFWTPASALGTRLRDRLTEHAGLAFEML